MHRLLVRFLSGVLLAFLAGSASVWAQESPKERNLVTFDLLTRQGTDDSDDNNGKSLFFELSPRVRFHQTRRHGFWELNYRTTFRRSSAVSNQDQFDHQFGLEAGFQLAKRWRMDFNASVLRSTNSFLRVAGREDGQVTPGDVLFGPNGGIVGPVRRFTILDSHFTAHYLLGPHSGLNFGADYRRDEEAGDFLPDTETQNFRVAYQRQYARNKNFSAMYSVQHFRLSAINYRVRTHSVLFFHTYEFKPGTQLAVFGGPQFSRVRAEPTVTLNFFFFVVPQTLRVSEPVNSLALGALFAHRVNDRTWLNFSVSRRVSEGGGFTGALIQKAARLSLRRNLTRRISASFAGYLTDNRSLGGVGLSQSLRTHGFSADFEYALSRRVSFRAGYQLAKFQSGPLRSRPRVEVGIRYSFGTFPVGR